MKFVAIFLCFFAQTYAMANPDPSKYEVLRQLYNESQQPADLSDFQYQNESPNQHCLAADGLDPNQLWEINVVRVKVEVNGGPLFPNDREKLLFFSGERNAEVKSFIDRVDFPQSTALDLVTHLRAASNFLDSPATLKARKNEKYISFVMTHYEGSANNSTLYGYCYSLR